MKLHDIHNESVVSGAAIVKSNCLYTNGQSGTGNSFPQNTPGLLQDALTVFTSSKSLAPYDTDGDGFVDGIFLIHADCGAEAEPNAAKRKDMIWSHKWTLPTPFVKNGVKVFAYSTEPADGKVGVCCHEFGHVLGLPDLYDTSNRSEGVGDWCLMGGGSWGNGGANPTRMSCWCLQKLGWIKPTAHTGTKTLTIPTLETDPKACYRLSTGGATGGGAATKIKISAITTVGNNIKAKVKV